MVHLFLIGKAGPGYVDSPDLCFVSFDELINLSQDTEE